MTRGIRRSAAMAVVLLACGGDQKSSSSGGMSYGEDAEQAYVAALEQFRSGNCVDAEPAFQDIRREYPYSRFAPLAELRLADCLLEQDKYGQAVQAYRRFVRFRPSHSEVPYAHFKIAQAHFRQIPDDWLLAPPAYERDQGPTREALRSLRRFILDFPDDERVPEAREMMRKALRLLARHELYVAEFYSSRDAPKATIRRLETLLGTYQGSGIEPRALLMLGRTYLEVDDTHQARSAFQRLVQEFPESEQAEKARKHLRKLGLESPSAASR